MPTNGTATISGLTHNQANDGVPFAAFGGDRPTGPITDFTILWRASGLPPNNSFITLQGFPYSSGGAFVQGTDPDGVIARLATYTQDPPGQDVTWAATGTAIPIVLTNGLSATLIRAFVNNTTGARNFEISWLSLDIQDPADWPGNDPPDAASDVEGSDPSWDPDAGLGTIKVTWTDNSDDEDGFVITRSKDGGPEEVAGNVPENTEEFTDYVPEEGTYVYKVYVYKYGPGPGGPALSPPTPPSPPIDVGGGGSADINITGSGGIDFGGTALFFFIGDPSGIYTLVPGKTHDTLYNQPGNESTDVAIPNPFIETAFIPEE